MSRTTCGAHDGVEMPAVSDIERVYAEIRPPLGEEAAVLEAERCLECGGAHAPAPCTVACPADVDVPGFVAAIAAGRLDHAAGVIFAENLLGGTCARVCPTELLCEGACVLAHEGQPPIAIGLLQRHAAEDGLERRLPVRRRARPTGRRIAVVGAGPAGLVCTGELAACGHDVTVYDERTEPGGLVRFAIAPYRQLDHPLPEEADLVRALGAHIVLGCHVDETLLRRLREENDALVLAVGLGDDTDAGIPGSDLDGVWASLLFIEAIKTGEPPAIGDEVVVIGGGNTAVDVAVEARRLGARRVTMLYRRTETEMPAYPQEVALAREEGVELEWLTAPTRFLGRERLEAVECITMRLGEPDAGGRARPEPVPGTERAVPADTAIVAIGQRGRPEMVGIAVDTATARTNVSGIYAAGDGVNGAPPSSRRCGRASSPPAPWTPTFGARRERDPLARTGRAGREDRSSALGSCTPHRGQGCSGLSRVRPGTARCSDACVHPVRRPPHPAA